MFPFSSLRSHPRVTLPSVDNGWLINNSIIKDPPKSIHTRRIDKVGSTQMVTDMIEDNGSRICGEIMKFPRGVNPAAEYTEPITGTNNSVGNTSTIRDNSGNPLTLRSDPGYMFHDQFGRGSGGYLARRIMMYSGAFRPPIYTQEQLLPLSRQPRVRTSCVTHPEMIDYTNRTNNIDLQKIIRDVIIKPPIDPTLARVIERSQEQHPTRDYIQEDKLLARDVSSGMRPRDITLKDNFKCFGQTKIDPTSAYAYTQPCSNTITRDTMLYVMEKPAKNYVREKLLHSNVVPNASGITKEGESKIGTNYTITYPRAVKNIVCPPRMHAMLPGEQPVELHSFVRDNVLKTYNVVNTPHLQDIAAHNILDTHQIDTDKYIHDTILRQNIDSGISGSNIVLNNNNSNDNSQIKLNTDMLYVPAHSQKTGLADKHEYIHTNKPGKKINIRQYETNAPKTGTVHDEYVNTQRRVRLQPKLSTMGSFDNVGYIPISNNGQTTGGIKNKISDGKLQNKIKQVHFERNPVIHAY